MADQFTEVGDVLIDQLVEPAPTGALARGWKTGVAGIKAAGQGIKALGANIVGAPEAQQAALDAGKETLQATAPDQMRVEDVSTFGEGVDFAKYAVGTALHSMLMMAGGGLLGKGAGALLGKRFAAEATRAMLSKAGLVGGAAASSFGLEAGSIFPDAVESKVEDPALRSVAGGVAAGALDILPGYAVARRLGLIGDAALKAPKATGAKAFLKSAAKDAATGTAFEGVTEGAQTFIERLAAGQDLTSPEAQSDYLNSLVIGGVSGGAVGGTAGGASAFLRRPEQAGAPVAPPGGPQAPPPAAPPATTPLPTLGAESTLPDIRDLGVPPVVDALPPAPDQGPQRGEVPAPSYRRGLAPVAQDADFAQLETLQAQLDAATTQRTALDAEAQLPKEQRRTKEALTKDSLGLDVQIAALRDSVGSLTQSIRNRFAADESATVIEQAPERTPSTEPAFTESGAFKRTPVEDTSAAELTVAKQKQSVGALVSSREAKLLRDAEKTAKAKPPVEAVKEENTPRGRFKTETAERRAEVVEGVGTESVKRHMKDLPIRKGTEEVTRNALNAAIVEASRAPTIELAEKKAFDAAIRALAGKVNKGDAETFAAAVAKDIRSAPTFYSKGGLTVIDPTIDSRTVVSSLLRLWQGNALKAAEDAEYQASKTKDEEQKKKYLHGAAVLRGEIQQTGTGGTRFSKGGQESRGALAVTKISDMLAHVPAVAAAHARTGGSSTDLVTGRDLAGMDGYAVSIYKDREYSSAEPLTEQQIAAYVEQHADILSDRGHMLGTWVDPETGMHFMDVSIQVPSVREALELGREHQQLAVFDLRTLTNIDIGHPLFDSAQEYNRDHGLTPIGGLTYKPLDEALGIKAAEAFGRLPKESIEPQVLASYAAMVAETEAQYEYASKVITIEPWRQAGQPYAGSREMREDVFKNNHLWVFEGGDPHPLITPEQIYKMRAVHDLYGHAQTGFEFGPRGEQNAARAHAQMYSDEAIPAHMTEFFGFTSWNLFADVNRGKPASQITYAENRVGLMPAELWLQLLAEGMSTKQAQIDKHDLIMTDKGQRLVAHLKAMIGNDPNLEVRIYRAEAPTTQRYNTMAGADAAALEYPGAVAKPIEGKWGVFQGDQEVSVGGEIGSYTRSEKLKSVISMAVNAKGDLSIADHEGFHYLEDKVLSGQERIIISRAFRPGAPMYQRVLEKAQAYDTANKTSLADEIVTIPQEARAYGYEFWRRGELQVDGPVAAVFEKIRQFLERVRNYIDGLGFRSMDDIFQAIARGEYAQRGGLSRVTEAHSDWASDVEPDVAPGMHVFHKKEGPASKAKGRPYWVKTGADVATMRARLKKLALEGEVGRGWHAKSAEAILAWAKGDKELAAKMAALIANFSPRTPVGLDLKKAFTAFVQYEAKQPLEPGAPMEHTLGARRILTGFNKDGSPAERDEAGNVRPTGIKRDNFFKNLMLGIDPKHYNVEHQGATIDMWMAHAFGFANDVQGSVTKSQYNYADAEVKRLAKELGWSVEEAQAAIWVAIKARGNSTRSLMERHAMNRGWYEQVEDKNAAPTTTLFGTEAGGTKRVVKADKQRQFVTEWMRISQINPISAEELTKANYDYAKAFEDIYAGKIDLSARLNDLPYEITKPAEQDGYDMPRQPELFSKGGVQNQTDTPEFKAWFGDSKVVDKNGKPLRVYHGTQKAGFDSFYSYSHFGTQEQARDILENKQDKRDFLLRVQGDSFRKMLESGEGIELGLNDAVYPIYLSIKNPKRVRDAGDASSWDTVINKALKEGHDGIIYRNENEGAGNRDHLVSDLEADSYIAFRPEQIKSAIGNRGTFSPDSPNILFSRGAIADMDRQMSRGELEREQGFSAALKMIDDAKATGVTMKQAFGAVSEEMTGGVARWMMSNITTQNYISRFSSGFRNVYQALSAYMRYKALLISEGSRVQLSKWNAGTQDDITAAFDALLKRTIGGYAVGSQEYTAVRAELTAPQREMFDQASTMIAGFLNRELAADEKTFKQLLGPQEYQTWLTNRTAQVKGLIEAGYIPERRHGDFTVTIYQDVTDATGVPHRVTVSHEQYEREAAAIVREQQYAEEIKKQGLPMAVVRGSRHNTARETEVSIQQFLDTARRNGVVITQPERERLAKSLTAADSMRRNRLMHRDNVPGMSRDGTRVLNEFVVTMANKIAYSEFSPAINSAATGNPVDARTENNVPVIDVDPSRNLWDEDGPQSGFYRNKADELTDYVLVPDHTGAWSKNLRGAAMGYFIGGSLAAAAVNTMSIPMLTVPALSQHTTYMDSFSTVLSAWKDTWANQGELRDITKLKDRDGYPIPMVDSVPGLRQALITAAEDGRTMDTEIHQIMGLSQGGILSKSRNVQKAINTWMAPFKVGEQTNRITTFIASYKIGQKNGLSGRALYDFSAGMVDATQNRYDEVNRPAAARNPIWAIMFMFKSFPIFMTEAIALMYKQNPKSAVYLLLGLTMMSGIQGLPFAEDILDLIDLISQRIFGSPFNARRAMRNTIKDASEALVGADLSEVVLRGVVNSMTGMNIGSRVGMGDMLPGTRIGSADGDYGRTVQQLLGAPVTMATDIAGGAATLAGGIFGKDNFADAVAKVATQSGPSAVRNVMKGLEQFNKGYALDAKGRKLVDITGPEALWQSMGFASAGLNQAYELDKIDRQTQAFYTQVRSNFTESLTRAILAGDAAKAQETMDAVSAWNTQYPTMPIGFQSATMRRHIVEAGLPLNERTMRMMPRQLRGTAIATEGTGSSQ